MPGSLPCLWKNIISFVMVKGMKALRSTSIVLARFFLSAIFLTAAVQQIFHWHETESVFVTTLAEWQTNVTRMPQVQEAVAFLMPWTPLLLLVAVLFQLMGGLLVLLGVKEKLGASLLFLFLVPTTFLFHPFWFFDGADRDLQQIMFLKNLSIMGGLLMVMLHGATTKANDLSGDFKF
jgi:putative oxidoreductase